MPSGYDLGVTLAPTIGRYKAPPRECHYSAGFFNGTAACGKRIALDQSIIQRACCTRQLMDPGVFRLKLPVAGSTPARAISCNTSRFITRRPAQNKAKGSIYKWPEDSTPDVQGKGASHPYQGDAGGHSPADALASCCLSFPATETCRSVLT